jgi:DNA-binding response OmpR family regulator
MARILVIDDEEEIRNALRRALAMEGYEVILASDGVEGERTFRETPPDLVITDIFMPGKEGIELVNDILADYPDTKMIVMSGGARMAEGHDLEFLLGVAESAGARRVIKKPFELDEILSLTRALLGNG